MRTVHKKHRDPQRARAAAECRLCGGELYRGDAFRRLAGRVLCADCAALLPPAWAARRLRLRGAGR